MTKPVVSITRTGDSIHVVSPYNVTFTAKAKSLSGRWDADDRSWGFAAQLEGEVRSLCLSIYGTDGTADAELVDVVLRCEAGAGYEMIETVFGKDMDHRMVRTLDLGGRVLFSVQGRDSGAKTAEGVIVRKGGFTSGGSVKNFEMKLKDEEAEQHFEILNLPAVVARPLVDRCPEYVSILSREDAEKPASVAVVLSRQEIEALVASLPEGAIKSRFAAL